MKLRNKKTGEIVDFGYLQTDYIAPLVLTTYENDNPKMYTYSSLTELNKEWEDYEEPKKYWYYDTTKNGVEKITHLEDKEKDQAIGNYFETKEEAEKAVEKLKAWKRLKDKGFRFDIWENDQSRTLGDFVIYASIKCLDDIVDDLNLLFEDEKMININDLPAFSSVSLTKEQAVKLAQIAKEAREKYEKNKKDD